MLREKGLEGRIERKKVMDGRKTKCHIFLCVEFGLNHMYDKCIWAIKAKMRTVSGERKRARGKRENRRSDMIRAKDLSIKI